MAINDDGTVTYTPNADFNGTDTFTYTNVDGNTETVTVTVDPIADDTVLVADSATTNEDTPITIDVVANDTDVDNGEVSPVDTVTQGANGAVAINDDGTVTYTPNADFNGTDTFTYTNVDGNTETVTVTVDPIADDTVLVADSATTNEDTPITIDVVANDTDVDNGEVSPVDTVTQGANGSVAINDDGTVTYTPNADFNGTDTFTYTNVDGNTETVTVTVDPIADDTVLVADSATTNEDTPITIDVTANDTDVDNGEVSPVDTVTQGTNGAVAINDDGTVTYTPNADFNGTDTFTYTNVDGNTETVTVTVDPVADDTVLVADSATTDEDTPVVIDVLSNDTDADGVTSPVASVTDGANGTVAINDDGTVTYTPNADFNGTDTFTYTNEDNNTETVTVTVSPVEDPTEILVGSSDSDLGEVTEDIDVTTDSKLTDSGTLTFSDVDIEDSENFEPTIEFSPTEDGDTALGEITIDVDGNWTYEVDNSAVQFLGEGETITEVYTVTLNGTTHDITITINGSDDPTTIEPVGTAFERGFVTEDVNVTSGQLTDGGRFQFTDADDSDSASFDANVAFVSSTSGTGQLGTMTITSGGVWSYVVDNSLVQYLDESDQIVENFVITVNGTEQEISVFIFGAEDPTEITVNSLVGDSAEGSVTEGDSVTDGKLIDSGTLTFSDVDTADSESFAPEVTFVGANDGDTALGELIIDADGNWSYEVDNSAIAYLDSDEQITETFTVSLNGETQDIVVTINGTDTLLAVDDAEAPISGLSGQYWGYDEDLEGGNTSSLTIVKDYIAANPTADIAFTSTQLDYTNVFGADLAANVSDGVPNNLIGFLNDDADSIATINGGSSTTATDGIIDLTGNLYVAEEGLYIIDVQHDDGFELIIDGEAVITFSAITSSIQTSLSLSLTEGLHSIEIIYWDQAGDYDLVLNMYPAGTAILDIEANNIWVAENLSYAEGISTVIDTSVTVELLSNDTGEGITVNSVSDPENGTITIVDGEVIYEPDSGYTGIDSFVYDIIDINGNISNTATAYVTVTHNAESGLIDADTIDDSTDSTDDQVLVGDGTPNEITGGDGDDIISGLSSNDTLSGAGGNDQLFGGDNNDILFGNTGNDELYGEQGTDTLDGGLGDDILTGGIGTDILIGGDGADTFVWTDQDTFGSDTISDFNVEEGDKLDLSDLLQGETEGDLGKYFDISFNGTDTTLSVSSNNLNENPFNTFKGTTIVLEDTQLDGVTHDGALSEDEVETVINSLFDSGALVITETVVDTGTTAAAIDTTDDSII
ncbi:beta strand repeat-containing protein [Psychromonas sp. L1A2]|uniref:beta strand repeat-containing protein n=1 Tax=Psychromonas sp. L1A2 TaxID=2686356 RepID=UPI001F38D8FF|nr:Ig-like domain-containing protein [Psychromonas sp. L1A2]